MTVASWVVTRNWPAAALQPVTSPRCRLAKPPLGARRSAREDDSLLPMLELFRDFFAITDQDSDQAARDNRVVYALWLTAWAQER
jgi:hypothetical protein